MTYQQQLRIQASVYVTGAIVIEAFEGGAWGTKWLLVAFAVWSGWRADREQRRQEAHRG